MRLSRETILISDAQRAKLFELGRGCARLFMLLQSEGTRHRGSEFPLPTKALVAVKGMSRPNLHRLIVRLEACGLILVARRPPKSPLITVL